MTGGTNVEPSDGAGGIELTGGGPELIGGRGTTAGIWEVEVVVAVPGLVPEMPALVLVLVLVLDWLFGFFVFELVVVDRLGTLDFVAIGVVVDLLFGFFVLEAVVVVVVVVVMLVVPGIAQMPFTHEKPF